MTLKELYQKATPLPWKVEASNGTSGILGGHRGMTTGALVAGSLICRQDQRAQTNHKLIAHAVNVLPELVEALEKVSQAMTILRPQCTEGADVADVLDSFIPAVNQALKKANHIEIK